MSASNQNVQPESDRLLPGWGWVSDFLAARYAHLATLQLHHRHWATVQEFLCQREIADPTKLKREHGGAFIAWRAGQGVTRVTAVRQAKFLSFLMEEAVLRELCEKNPLRRLGISVGPVPEKPEVTPEMEQELRDAIDRYKSPHRDFLRLSMELGIYQGRRISETRLPLANVDFEHNRIKFWVKGQKWHTAPLHPYIRSVLLPLKESGREWTFDEARHQMSRIWRDFLKRKGFQKKYPKLCHHCFRVTCISRLARAGVTESKAMKFVGHSSVSIHRIYMRLGMDDLADCLNALPCGQPSRDRTHSSQ